MSHKKLRPFIVKVSVLGYFPLYNYTCRFITIVIIIYHIIGWVYNIHCIYLFVTIIRYIKVQFLNL